MAKMKPIKVMVPEDFDVDNSGDKFTFLIVKGENGMVANEIIKQKSVDNEPKKSDTLSREEQIQNDMKAFKEASKVESETDSETK